MTNQASRGIQDIRERPLTNFRILYVEDDPDSREVLQLFLEQNGACVRSVRSASEALDVIKSMNGSRFDAIISDLAMPEEDGYSLMSRIRALPGEMGGSVPALALSAFTTPENRDLAFTTGFQRYHTKPFEPEKLISDLLYIINAGSTG